MTPEMAEDKFAALLNVTRSALIGALFNRFVVKEDREKYGVYRVGLDASEGLQVTRILASSRRGDVCSWWSRIEAVG